MSESMPAPDRSSVGKHIEEFPHVWWRPDDPTEIFMTLVTPKLTDENKQRPGMWNTYSTNWRSANYDPANFNRLARFLADNNLAAPPQVEVGSRRLSVRFKKWMSSTAPSSALEPPDVWPPSV